MGARGGRDSCAGGARRTEQNARAVCSRPRLCSAMPLDDLPEQVDLVRALWFCGLRCLHRVLVVAAASMRIMN